MVIQRMNQSREKMRKGSACIFFRANSMADKMAKTLITMTRILISGLPKKCPLNPSNTCLLLYPNVIVIPQNTKNVPGTRHQFKIARSRQSVNVCPCEIRSWHKNALHRSMGQVQGKKEFSLSHAPTMAVVIAGGLFRRNAAITGGQKTTREYNQYECGNEAFHGFHFGVYGFFINV